MIDMDQDVALLRSLFAAPTSVARGMSKALAYCRSKYGIENIERLIELPFEEETGDLKEWVARVLQEEPPPESVQAYYFGLFDSVGRNEKIRPCLYISGSETFDSHKVNPDWASSPSYFPKGRYVISDVLLTLEEAARDSEKYDTELSYILQISFAGLAVSRIMHDLPTELTLGKRASRGVAVGFDEGDLFLLQEIVRQPQRSSESLV